ncbi:DUF2977 domain-containing protein (plasmid) [Bacillus subtilis subsp. subtilis]|nr:DUF2977 domain-containing protein [Bacillus subtilis subsp. subtilis]
MAFRNAVYIKFYWLYDGLLKYNNSYKKPR